MQFQSYNEDATGDPKARILVTGIPVGTEIGKVYEFFNKYGEVKSVRMEPEPVKVTFQETKMADKFRSEDTFQFEGVTITVFRDESPGNQGAECFDQKSPIASNIPENLPPPPEPGQSTIVVHGVLETLREIDVKFYFQNHRRSEGGPIEDIDFDRKNGVKITFESPDVARKVVGKKDHKISKCPLIVRMYVPPIMDKKQILISDILPDTNKDLLENFVEPIAELEVVKAKKINDGTWLICFAGEIDFEKFQKTCISESNKDISESYPKVKQVPVPRKIIVSGYSEKWDQNTLENYFRNPLKPDELISCRMLTSRRCVITFKDSVVASEMTKIKQKEFKIKLYNDYDDDEKETNLDLPPNWIKFLMDQKEASENKLKDFGNPVWAESEESLKIKFNDDIEEEEIKNRVEAIVHEKLHSISHGNYEKVKEKCKNKIKDEQHLRVYFDDDEFTAHIFSFDEREVTDCFEKMVIEERAEATILVINFPTNTKEKELKKYFEKNFGEVQSIDMDLDAARITFRDSSVAEKVVSEECRQFKGVYINLFKDIDEREVPGERAGYEIDTKTICVDGVPDDMDLSDLQTFFGNKSESGGGEIEGFATRDPKTKYIEITFSKEKTVKRIIERSPLNYKNYTLHVNFKQPLKEESLSGNIPESNPASVVVHGVPKDTSLKTVELYFENESQSEGGKIQDINDDILNGIKITFASSDVARNVVKKKGHAIGKCPLMVKMYDPTMIEEKQVLISDIKDEITDDMLTNFFEVKAKVKVESAQKIDRVYWLISCADKIDFENLKDCCKSDAEHYLSDSYPKVKQVSVPNRIIVRFNSENWDKNRLDSYFADPRKPDDFVSSEMLGDGSFIISFKDASVASEMTLVKNAKFGVEPFYDYMECMEIYIDINLPSPFWIQFLMDQKKVIEDKLKDFGNPVWGESNEKFLIIRCNYNIEKGAIENWLRSNVHEESSVIPHDIYLEVEEIIKKDDEPIHVYFDNENSTAYFFSFNKSKVTDYVKKIGNIVESKPYTEEIKLESYKIDLFQSDLFSPKIYTKYRKLKIHPEEEKLVLTGDFEEVKAVGDELNKFFTNIHSLSVMLPKNAHQILSKIPVKEYINRKLKTKDCICAWEADSEEGVIIYMLQKNNLELAANILRECIVDLNFHLTDQLKRNIWRGKWHKFLKDMSEKYADKNYIESTSENISIVTTDEEAPNIKSDFNNFFILF